MFEQHNEDANDGFEDAQDDYDENVQEEKVWDDRRLSDFDLLKGIMQSEYGNNEFSNSAKITDTGDYDLDLERDDPDRENYRKRANYIMLSRLLGQLEGPNFVVPSFDVMESHGIIRSIKPRFSPKTGNFLGIDYRMGPFKPFKKVIVYGKGGILRYTEDISLRPLLNDFRAEIMKSSELYQEVSSGIIDSEMNWDGYLDALGINRGTPEGWVKAKNEKDRTRREIMGEYLTQLEDGMGELFPKLLKEFETLKVPERNGVPYHEFIENIMRPIYQFDWYKEENVPEDVYNREIEIMEKEIDDIRGRIEDSRSVREQKAYKNLIAYLEQREETLNIFFDKPLRDNFKAKLKAFVKRQAKSIFSRTLGWIKSNLPEFLAGITVSAGSMIFGIYQLAVNMGKGIVEKGKKALKELENKIKEYAEKQSAPIKALMNMVGSLVGHGGGFILSHLKKIILAVVFVLSAYGGYRLTRPRQRVKVKYEHER